MKITCQSCQAKYTIADEKVVGKTVKIKCRKCGATIVVHGTDAGQQGEPPASQPPPSVHLDEDAATHVYNKPSTPADAPAADEWTVNVRDEEQRAMTLDQIVAEYRAGTITRDTYAWRDGMADWLPLGDVPELISACEAAPMSAKKSESPFARPAATAVLGTRSLNALGQATPAPAAAAPIPTPSPSAASAAARRAAARPAGSVDLFGASALAQREKPPSSAPPPAAPPGDKHVGERNENSVLFSLSALTAAESAAKAAADRGDAVIDLGRPAKPASSGGNGGRAGLDDILNLGGGIGSPMLAPPPLTAPVLAPPPPPPVSAPAMSAPLTSTPFIATPFDAPKKRPVALIAGIAGGAVLIVIVAVLAFRGGSKETAASNDAANASATPTAAPTTAAAATDTSAPADTSSPSPSSTPGAQAAATKPGSRAATPGARSTDRSDKSTADNSDTPKKDDSPPAAAAPPPPTPKADAPPAAAAPAAGGGGEFSRAAASSALNSAAASARSCKKPDGPTGTGRVKVTFAPNGTVQSASVDPPFGGTAVGGCVASAFKGAHVPPFEGGAVTVSKSFTIN